LKLEIKLKQHLEGNVLKPNRACSANLLCLAEKQTKLQIHWKALKFTSNLLKQIGFAKCMFALDILVTEHRLNLPTQKPRMNEARIPMASVEGIYQQGIPATPNKCILRGRTTHLSRISAISKHLLRVKDILLI